MLDPSIVSRCGKAVVPPWEAVRRAVLDPMRLSWVGELTLRVSKDEITEKA